MYVVLKRRGWTNMILNLHVERGENFSGLCFVFDFYQTGNLGSDVLIEWVVSSKLRTSTGFWILRCSSDVPLQSPF